jgi:hypothetical protein
MHVLDALSTVRVGSAMRSLRYSFLDCPTPGTSPSTFAPMATIPESSEVQVLPVPLSPFFSFSTGNGNMQAAPLG